MRCQIGFGQWIDSDRPIPGAIAGTGSATLRIRHLPPASFDPADALYERTENGLVFQPPDVGRYRCDRTDIVVTPHVGANAEHVSALLIATALPACLWLQGAFLLHAAAVRLPGQEQAIVVAGPSGAGKSTIAAELVARDGYLVADDCVAVSRNASNWTISGLPGGWFTRNTPDRDREFIPVREGRASYDAIPMAILIVTREARQPGLQRLGSLRAIEAILANQHRPRIPAVIGCRGECLKTAVQLAGAIPVYAWHRREGARHLDGQEWSTLEAMSGG